LAVQWLYEELQTDLKNARNSDYQPKYNHWLLKLLTSALPILQNNDRSLSKLLLDAPELNAEVVELLKADMDRRPDRYKATVLVLHDLALFRPPVRPQCLDVLLNCCTLQDKNKRAFAILDVRKWVPDHALSPLIEEFSIQTIRRLLEEPPKKVQPPIEPNLEQNGTAAMDISEGQQNGNQPDGEQQGAAQLDVEVAQPTTAEWDEETVIPHLELYFALCSKKPELLNS
jgi:symplekin